MTQKLILAPLLHEELPFNCVVCSKLKSNGGSGKQNHSCAGVPGAPQLPLSSSVCIESSKGRIFWLERSLLFRKIGICRISSPSECLWVGTFRTCKIHKTREKPFEFSLKILFTANIMKPPAFYAADMLWGQNPVPTWKYQMHFYWCISVMLVFFKPILSMPWTSSFVVELKTVQTWKVHRFHGSCFQWIFSDFQLTMEPWSALLMILLFACPMCYRMQAQGGTSSSVHLAGATSICFLKS